jgi:hypothetical protein
MKPTLSDRFMIYLRIATRRRADERTRTAHLPITSELLYLLSYVASFQAQSIFFDCNLVRYVASSVVLHKDQAGAYRALRFDAWPYQP